MMNKEAIATAEKLEAHGILQHKNHKPLAIDIIQAACEEAYKQGRLDKAVEHANLVRGISEATRSAAQPQRSDDGIYATSSQGEKIWVGSKTEVEQPQEWTIVKINQNCYNIEPGICIHLKSKFQAEAIVHAHNAALASERKKFDALAATQFDLEQRAMDWCGKAKELESQLAAAVEALELLRDCQNGCPLPKYEKDWNRAMELAEAALAKCQQKGGDATCLTTTPQSTGQQAGLSNAAPTFDPQARQRIRKVDK